MTDRHTLNVLIAGGGCAALEAAFRLQRVAENRVRTTILAPDEYLATHALAVLVPFAAGVVPREPLAGMASDAGARLRRGRMTAVDSVEHQVITDDGDAVDYDALLIAIGAVARTHPRALAFGGPGSERRMHGLIQDLEGGFVHRIVFVVPEDASWPVPLYELALLTADRAYDMCLTPELTIVTPERAPLELFGFEAAGALTKRLADAGVTLITGTHAEVMTPRMVNLGGSSLLAADRVVTLPSFEGPAVPGLPHNAAGYLRVDPHGRVDGVPDVFAAGDVTHHRIKQGGLACQQADAAADAIAALAGAAVAPQPYTPALQGVLLTEHAETFLRRNSTKQGGETVRWPPVKLAGRELSRHLSGVESRRCRSAS
jgi:sulfide:quinone oxidoreductase